MCSCGRLGVGETCRPIHQRLAEHKNACKGSCVEWSEVEEYMMETGHEVEWSRTQRFVDYGMSATKRKIREVIEINRLGNGGRQLSKNFLCLIERLKDGVESPSKRRRLNLSAE
ncbi:unnamed protein product [Protopolystoma xenopodis]|uniref:Uncharacterized protein n=1 Tax=Protopolystoma xenopodis TaxID=117903 RepID=A0A448XD54_9PLAT|nr:unnamed protein product [Protopolystoma xenopodis]